MKVFFAKCNLASIHQSFSCPQHSTFIRTQWVTCGISILFTAFVCLHITLQTYKLPTLSAIVQDGQTQEILVLVVLDGVNLQYK